jgi:hypothetical protein
MLRKFIGAVVLVLVGSVALGETIRGIITKADEKEITITPYEGKGKEAKKGDEKKIKVNAKTTYAKGVGKDKSEDIEKDGLKALQTAIEKSKGGKGVFARVEEEKGTATKITFFSFTKKKPKKDKDLD